MGQLETLLALADARTLVCLPGNDFAWTGWSDAKDAVRQIDQCLLKTWNDQPTASLATLFAPTGPLQELSLSSGWGAEMIEVADRFDRAQTSEDCACLSPPFRHDAFKEEALGVDETEGRFAEVRIEHCKLCQLKFLRYFFEIEGLSQSGRWFRAALPLLHPHPSPKEAPQVLSLAPFHYVGGSYFSSTGTLQLRPFDPHSL